MKHLKTFNESIRDLMTPKSNEDIIKALPLDDRIKDILISKGFEYTDHMNIVTSNNEEKIRYFFKCKKQYFFSKNVAVVQTTDDVETVIKYLNNF
jgi:hypothetical protein